MPGHDSASQLYPNHCEPPPPGVAASIILYGPPPQQLPPPSPEDGLAADKRWYLEGRPIPFQGKQYVPFGRHLSTQPTAIDVPPLEVVYCGEYDRVPIYVSRPLEPYPRFIFVQLDSGKQFQPYAEVSEVRGSAAHPRPALAALMPSVPPAHDTSTVYEAVLTDLKGAELDRPLVLNERVLAGHCAPHCRDANLAASHPRPWLDHLLASGVIARTCTPPDDRSIGCIPRQGSIGVSLGAVTFEDGRAEIDVILFGPTAGRIIDAEGVHFMLERQQDGRWVVAERRRTWIS